MDKTEIDVAKATRALRSYIKEYGTSFDNLSKRQTALLEIGAMTIATEHYRRAGYSIKPHNLQAGLFRVKISTRGRPWNFSWFECIRDNKCFEIHSNMPVYGYYGDDLGRYTVDVAVIRSDSLPSDESSREGWKGLPNKSLVSFIEAKKLVIYPMLLAQFIGIVHEIQPGFLNNKTPHSFHKNGHFFPSLVSIGYLHGQSRGIVEHLPRRGFRVCVCDSFDIELARLRRSSTRDSPFSTRTAESRAVRCSTGH